MAGSITPDVMSGARRVFLDESNMAANPDLWGSIESALGASNAFLLLASPASARSQWVQRELRCFFDRRQPARLCIALTEGWTPWTQAGAELREPSLRAVSDDLVTALEGRGWELPALKGVHHPKGPRSFRRLMLSATPLHLVPQFERSEAT